ncbi:MAG: MBOAT family protein [Firmicutes bacterium]|nr:MBOAT family protein [Bacillota bacterium]
MVFSSTVFLFFFLPIVLLLYYLVPNRLKNVILLIGSLIFYAWGEPIYVFLMCFSSFVDYLNGILLAKNDNDKTRKRYLFIAIFINLSLLGFFKYSDFLIEILNNMFGANIPLLNIGLPIGISFYTFQTMSYSIDVYRKSVNIEKNYFRYLTYVSLFPQLVAGPIVRYSTIADEIKSRKIVFNDIADGFLRFLRGLFKKVLLANNIGSMYEIILGSEIEALSVMTLWFGVLGYAIQIYFDFSGYSDMAIGIGRMLGFHFDENFNYPYISKSIGEFWRRWHISLGTWFKDYILYPFLKSNRVQKLQSFLKLKLGKNWGKNLTVALGTLLVFFLTGLWHGANYNYIYWGLYYAFFLIAEDFFLKKYLRKHTVLSHIYVLFVVLLGYVIFSIEDINLLETYFQGMFGFVNIPFIDNDFFFYLCNYGIIMLIGLVFCFPIAEKIPDKIKNNAFINVLRGGIYIILFLISICYIVSDTYNPFLYFRF